MPKYIGEIVFRDRLARDLTQDEYAARYGVTGPMIFKVEKGYARPKLELWLRMAHDAGLSERRAVLVWLKAKLPEKYQDYVEFQSATAAEKKAAGKKKRGTKGGTLDYAKLKTRDDILAAASKDRSLPKGLRDLLNDDELWGLYKPTGREINMLADMFGPLGTGSKDQYRDGLRVVREFKGG